MVAGAYKADLLSDFRSAVDKSITQGISLGKFQQDFDSTVSRNGWSYHGSRNWRSELIYSTNLRTSYAAGRWEQLTNPEQIQVLPYLTYKHGDSRVPRPIHLSWDGLTLPANDPWWQTHYPPNGWGCKCRVFGSTRNEYEAAQQAGKAKVPDDGTYTPTDKDGKPLIDPTTGKVEQIPNGIDRGWDYNVGTAAFGKSWVQETGEAIELGPWRKEQYPFLPQKLTGDAPLVALGPRLQGDEAALRAAVPEGVYQDKLGDPVSVTGAVASHIIADPKRWDGREQYLPLLPDVIENSQEIWVGFMQFVESGRVFIRKRYVKAYEIEKGRVVGVLADTVKGKLEAFDIIRSEDLKGGRLRSGRLVYPTEE